jgi:hypothetical protein
MNMHSVSRRDRPDGLIVSYALPLSLNSLMAMLIHGAVFQRQSGLGNVIPVFHLHLLTDGSQFLAPPDTF